MVGIYPIFRTNWVCFDCLLRLLKCTSTSWWNCSLFMKHWLLHEPYLLDKFGSIGLVASEAETC